MQSIAKKGVGMGIMGIGMILGIAANRYAFFSLPFFGLLTGGLLLWYIGSFHFVIDESNQRKSLAKWMMGLVFALLAPLSYLYADTLQNLARFENLPTTQYTIIKIISSGVFIASLISLWRNVRQQQKQQKKK